MTEVRTLTLDEAIRLLRRAVDEKGADFQYERVEGLCMNFHPETKQPSCIVGHVISYMGFTFDDFGPDYFFMNQDGAGSVLEHLDVEVDEKALDLLYGVQNAQDTGRSWGEAVDQEIRRFGR